MCVPPHIFPVYQNKVCNEKTDCSERRAVNNRDQDAEQSARKYLNGRVPDKFLELFFIGKGLSHFFPESDHFIEQVRLNAGFAADAPCVVHDDDGENGGNGKFKAADPVLKACGGRKCAHGRGVGAWHAAAAHEPLRVEFPVEKGINDRF